MGKKGAMCMDRKKDMSWIWPVILLVGSALLIGAALVLYWLFHTPVDWGVAV